MANPEHLDILSQGVEVWNVWRREHSNIKIDLSKANLEGAYLVKAELWQVNLCRANFCEALLNLADFFEADLSGANFCRADLGGVDLSESNLGGANLEGASLIGTNLFRADLRAANFKQAIALHTIFGNVDLNSARELDKIEHHGPSVVGIDTIYRSQGNIPEAFLKGAGVPDSFITYARSLVGHPIDFYSCFISYSSKDQAFAERLYSDLQSKGVRCWFAPEDMKIGDRIRPRIDESIRMYDKLLLVLSENSVISDWVEYEVETALAKETKGKLTVLFPIRLDDTAMQSTTAWAAHTKNTRHIGDFRGWKNHDDYKKAFDRLLRDLKAASQ